MPRQENIAQEQKTPFAQIQEKDKADFLLALKSVEKIEDKTELRQTIGNLVSSALSFFQEHSEEGQAFPWMMKKLTALEMSCDPNVFDRSFSQEQVDELINLICENKKDGDWQQIGYFSGGLFSTNMKERDEVDTIIDQTAIALTKKLQNGETIKAET